MPARGSGALRQRVTVERATESADGFGGTTRVWSDIATIKAEVLAQVARESNEAGAVLERVSWRIRLRFRQDIKTGDRLVLDNGETLNIRGVMDPDGRRRWLTLLAESGVAT